MLPYLALEASAGSGKTFALSVRYISLMYLGVNPNKILTLTFTNKAALEMKVKIFETLKNLEDSNELHEISRLTKISTDKILSKKPKILKLFLNSDIKISTIDSFFSSILRKFSFNIGLMPDFSIDEELIDDELIERFVKICQKQGLYKSLILFSVRENKKIKDIFSLFKTIYEKECELDMVNFVQTLTSSYTKEQIIWKILEDIKYHFAKNGLSEKLLKTFDVSNIDELLDKGFISKEDFNYWSYKKYADDNINTLHKTLKSELVLYAKEKEAYILREIAKQYSAFKQAMYDEAKNKSKLSFLDMTNRLYSILKDEISKDFLYFRMDGNFTHLLIDEFQDTSIVQYKIIEPFMEEIVAGKGTQEHRSLFIVGDTKQSIYRFRGGSKELFSYAADSMHLQKGVLDTNYRSSHNVVNFVNNIFMDKITGYKKQNPHPEKPDGFVKVDFSENLIDNFISNLKSLLSDGILESDIAILCFTNSEALSIKDAIKHEIEGIKVTMEAKQKLINIPIISGIIDFIFYLYFDEEIYLKNFEIACAKSLDNYAPWNFNINVEVFELITDIINHFEIFYNEEDLLYFTELSRNFKDVEDFVFNYTKLTQSSISKDKQGIRVLTIHKSKGLEFPTVLIMDRLKRPRNSTETLLFDYDGIQLNNIFLRIKGRENVDTDYALAKEKEKVYEGEDLLNAQYVAFTRAKNNLIIFAKEKNSAFENLDLQSYETGKIVVSEEKEKTTIQEDIDIYIPEKYGSQKQEKNDSLNMKSGDIYSIDFGLGLHYMLEIIGGFDKVFVDDAYNALKNRYGLILSEEDLIEIKNRVLGLLEDKVFLSLIDGGKIHKEQPIYYDSERKQLDLLIEKEGEIIVLDYKTSNFSYESHLVQVELYKRALEDIYKKKCSAYLCYLKHESCEIINLSDKS
ncbi:MAG: RecB-like helicase [Sulfurospirillaceae bacterium]|nr:RecB-like helicase [Sulfurospirillaceae bacterium]